MSPAPKRAPKAGTRKKLSLRKQTVTDLAPDGRRRGAIKGGVSASGGVKQRYNTYNCLGKTALSTA